MRRASIPILALVLATPAALGAAVEGEAGEFGIGAIGPDPFGVTAKWFFARNNAVDVAAGFEGLDTDEVVVHGDWLVHFPDLWTIPQGELPLYAGVGARFLFDDDPPDDDEDEDLRVGIRAPVGVARWPSRYHFEVFGELAPLLEVDPDDDFDLTVAGGSRWYP